MKLDLPFVASITCALLCGCESRKVHNLPKGKAVLNLSFVEKELLLSRLGFTNLLYSGPVERDSTGRKLFIQIETGPSFSEATQHLVIVMAGGTRIIPWRLPANERVTDDERIAVWEARQASYRWQTRSGAWLPPGSDVEDVSGDWIAVTARSRAPWIANLDTPDVVAVELPKDSGFTSIFAKGDTVHVFARRGWRNEEGPMMYLVYNFKNFGTNAIQKETLLWGRAVIDMDPTTEFAVINDNSRFWGKSWLVDLNTGKRKWISTTDWTLIVQKDLAEKWAELTKR
jgi:hypothetical protein